MSSPSKPFAQTCRYLAIGLLNTVFAYTLYALLLTAGLHLFLAQMIATVIAVIFNYFTYSRHVFDGNSASISRFLLSYGLNYLVSLLALAGSIRIVASPYLAGFIAMILSSAINFMVLKRLVFVSNLGPTNSRAIRFS